MKYFFASDSHLGLSTHRPASESEKLFERWLIMVERSISEDGSDDCALFLLGDIFDFWFEYKRVVPKGFTTIFAQLKRMCDKGIPIFFLKGNHDCWCRGYFESLGMKVVKTPYLATSLGGKNFYLSHGDYACTKYSIRSKIMYSIFNSKIAYRAFSCLVHPNITMFLGTAWSNKSRKSKYVTHKFRYEEESIVKYIRKREESGEKCDFYIVGHYHSGVEYKLSDDSKLLVLGHWIDGDIIYGVYDNEGVRLEKFSVK